MLMQTFRFLVGFIASEQGVKKQAILPVAWVAAVMMAGAVVLSLPEKAQADTCWLGTCAGQHPTTARHSAHRGVPAALLGSAGRSQERSSVAVTAPKPTLAELHLPRRPCAPPGQVLGSHEVASSQEWPASSSWS